MQFDAHPSVSAAAGAARLAFEQLEHALWQLVGLGHHRRSSLLQDLGPRQVGGFHREVGILNSGAGSAQVLRCGLQAGDGGLEPGLQGAKFGPLCGDYSD